MILLNKTAAQLPPSERANIYTVAAMRSQYVYRYTAVYLRKRCRNVLCVWNECSNTTENTVR